MTPVEELKTKLLDAVGFDWRATGVVYYEIRATVDDIPMLTVVEYALDSKGNRKLTPDGKRAMTKTTVYEVTVDDAGKPALVVNHRMAEVPA